MKAQKQPEACAAVLPPVISRWEQRKHHLLDTPAKLSLNGWRILVRALTRLKQRHDSQIKSPHHLDRVKRAGYYKGCDIMPNREIYTNTFTYTLTSEPGVIYLGHTEFYTLTSEPGVIYLGHTEFVPMYAIFLDLHKRYGNRLLFGRAYRGELL
jgi:hypothetical protein